MQEVKNIERVVFPSAGIDLNIPNTVAVFYVKESSAVHHMRQSAIKVARSVAELVDPDIGISLTGSNTTPEHRNMWIVLGGEYEDTASKVSFIHKTWDREYVEVFREIIRLLGHLHSWKIEE